MTSLPAGPFATIYADPPWNFKVRSPKGARWSASQHYDTMSLADIKALPVADIAAKDCALFLWATDPMLDQAFDVLDSWGFEYKTIGFYWIKENRKAPGYFMGGGYWTRANPEVCLLATRGKPKRINADVRRLVSEPRREHSRKPDRIRTDIERLVNGPYLEMFARSAAPGWTAWGNETEKFGVVD